MPTLWTFPSAIFRRDSFTLELKGVVSKTIRNARSVIDPRFSLAFVRESRAAEDFVRGEPKDQLVLFVLAADDSITLDDFKSSDGREQRTCVEVVEIGTSPFTHSIRIYKHGRSAPARTMSEEVLVELSTLCVSHVLSTTRATRTSNEWTLRARYTPFAIRWRPAVCSQRSARARPETETREFGGLPSTVASRQEIARVLALSCFGIVRM